LEYCSQLIDLRQKQLGSRYLTPFECGGGFIEHLERWSRRSGSYLESGTVAVGRRGGSGGVIAARLMLFCAGGAVDDDAAVDGVFLVNPVCGLRSAVCSLQMSYTGNV